MSDYQSTERHPLTSFLQLLLFVLAGAVFFTCLSLIIGNVVYGSSGMDEFRESVSGYGTEGMGFLKMVQIISTIGTFIIPALIFARMHGGILSYLNLNKRFPVVLILVSIAIMFAFVPLLEWTIDLNKAMHLPGFLKGIETWMRNKEDQLDMLTKQLLVMAGVSALMINLFMIALLPAIGEEFIFRGCLQKIFISWTRNYHWGIWIAAILFSAIHLQFYGFIPRMLLGALFGYLYVWGRSLWLPVIAHFVNNATTVVMAYLYQQQGKSLDKLEETAQMQWPAYLFSAILTIVLLSFVYRLYQKTQDESPGTDPLI